VKVLEATDEGGIKKSSCNKCTNLYFLYLVSFHFGFLGIFSIIRLFQQLDMVLAQGPKS
jgi:hypothetical protein